MRIRISQSTLAIGVTFVGLGVGIFLQTQNRPLAHRTVASLNSPGSWDSLKIKTQTIESIQWKDLGDKFSLQVSLPASMGCDAFSQASIFVRPEGLSEDGEVTSFELPVSCQGGHFSLELSKSIRDLKEKSLNQPDFFEIPKQFIISQIRLTGPSGKMAISGREIQHIKGQNYQFEAIER